MEHTGCGVFFWFGVCGQLLWVFLLLLQQPDAHSSVPVFLDTDTYTYVLFRCTHYLRFVPVGYSGDGQGYEYAETPFALPSLPKWAGGGKEHRRVRLLLVRPGREPDCCGGSTACRQ